MPLVSKLSNKSGKRLLDLSLVAFDKKVAVGSWKAARFSAKSARLEGTIKGRPDKEMQVMHTRRAT